jgi:cyclopropane fatty-acyl-phospholipid synthase-like methyltransferase
MKSNIKKMNLYKNSSRILRDLEFLGFENDCKVGLKLLNKFDQLHYHGIQSVNNCIKLLSIEKDNLVLEVGAGWGGPSRVISNETGAKTFALELQEDYSDVGRQLTGRTGLSNLVKHITSDFLEYSGDGMLFDKIVSWLALYHIPRRKEYLTKIYNLLKAGGQIFIEDLTLGKSYTSDDDTMLDKKLFANSMLHYQDYAQSMSDIGFKLSLIEDMSLDWKNFTQERHKILLKNKKSYIEIHGTEGYGLIEDFYNTAYTSFDREIIGGIRIVCSK